MFFLSIYMQVHTYYLNLKLNPVYFVSLEQSSVLVNDTCSAVNMFFFTAFLLADMLMLVDVKFSSEIYH